MRGSGQRFTVSRWIPITTLCHLWQAVSNRLVEQWQVIVWQKASSVDHLLYDGIFEFCWSVSAVAGLTGPGPILYWISDARPLIGIIGGSFQHFKYALQRKLQVLGVFRESHNLLLLVMAELVRGSVRFINAQRRYLKVAMSGLGDCLPSLGRCLSSCRRGPETWAESGLCLINCTLTLATLPLNWLDISDASPPLLCATQTVCSLVRQPGNPGRGLPEIGLQNGSTGWIGIGTNLLSISGHAPSKRGDVSIPLLGNRVALVKETKQASPT